MTNEQIIFNARCELLKDGVIGVSGRFYTDDEGHKYEEPEEIHTYQAWKEQGFQVQKGQKAVAKIQIWKHTVKKAKHEDEEDKEQMFMKIAAFFTRAQVEPIEARA